MANLIVAKSGGQYTTIQAAANIAQAGDTVQVKSGTYNEYVTIKNSGSAGKYITFKAEGKVTVTYPYGSMPAWSGIFWVKGKNYIIIDGFKTIGGYTGIDVDGSSNIIITNNYVENPYSAGIKVGWGSSNNIIVDKNIVNRFATSGIQYNEMISISNAHNSEIRNNHVMQNSLGEAIVIKDQSSFIKVFNNFSEHATVGIYCGGPGTNNVDIYNNIAINNDQSQTRAGILLAHEMRLTDTPLHPTPTLLYVYDNWASGQTVGIGISLATSSGNLPKFGTVEFKNNRACGNSWKNYLFDSSRYEISNLVSEGNTTPANCTPPIWNPGDILPEPDQPDPDPEPPQPPEPQAMSIEKAFMIIGGTLIVKEIMK